MYRGTFAIVDERAIRHNVAAFKQKLSDSTRLLIAVKANGYGHGAVEVAQAALGAGATDLGVASIEEALQLRRAGIAAPILVLGVVSPTAARTAAKWQIAVTLGDDWSEYSVPQFEPPLHVHIKIDTGMSRLGFKTLDEVLPVVRWINSRPDVVWSGIFTHLATADAADYSRTKVQIARFEQILAGLKAQGFVLPLVHAANSAGILRDPNWHYDMVRLGISTYGCPPSREMDVPVSLWPTLHLYSFITRVATIDRGEGVSYGASFVADRPTKVATVPVGYADGYPRALSNRAHVVIHGQKARVIGKVCMDQLMVDVTEIDDVHPGDCVTLYGRYAPEGWRQSVMESLPESEHKDWLIRTFRNYSGKNLLPLDDVAKIGHTISYELMCALSLRVPRIYVKN
ncbi:alanine racemase [Alicyclobacillus tolerans]|uniref:alanine racemase n=1 Tax=Alicyclobacillus tolerans TaxID=90970 RepID=UPI001F031193|nr:alanine racemase [Alicyclobacillus tolerans]MCF8566368.1 alanine racemase [Alicyclobacillus tolerans]